MLHLDSLLCVRRALLLGLGCNPNLSDVSLDLSCCEVTQPRPLLMLLELLQFLLLVQLLLLRQLMQLLAAALL